jgi:hypothetical protein
MEPNRALGEVVYDHINRCVGNNVGWVHAYGFVLTMTKLSGTRITLLVWASSLCWKRRAQNI